MEKSKRKHVSHGHYSKTATGWADSKIDVKDTSSKSFLDYPSSPFLWNVTGYISSQLTPGTYPDHLVKWGSCIQILLEIYELFTGAKALWLSSCVSHVVGEWMVRVQVLPPG